MAEKQTDADKALAMREYREKHDAAMRRIATLRAARLARDAALPTPERRNQNERSWRGSIKTLDERPTLGVVGPGGARPSSRPPVSSCGCRE